MVELNHLPSPCQEKSHWNTMKLSLIGLIVAILWATFVLKGNQDIKTAHQKEVAQAAHNNIVANTIDVSHGANLNRIGFQEVTMNGKCLRYIQEYWRTDATHPFSENGKSSYAGVITSHSLCEK